MNWVYCFFLIAFLGAAPPSYGEGDPPEEEIFLVYGPQNRPPRPFDLSLESILPSPPSLTPLPRKMPRLLYAPRFRSAHLLNGVGDWLRRIFIKDPCHS